jgi:hypothetical protein
MTQTDLTDVHSVTLLEASESAAGLCEMTADRQTDRQVLISLAACLASSNALPCHVGVLLFRKRVEHLWNGVGNIQLPSLESNPQVCQNKTKMPYLHCGVPGYDILLLTVDVGGSEKTSILFFKV